MIGILSKGISRIQYLTELLGESWVLLSPWSIKTCDRVACWGLRPTALKAAHYALKHNLPLLRLEDGFLRSVALGHDEPPLSIVIDEIGIYYDATTPSQLETLIKFNYTSEQQQRALALQTAWQTARVSKYNHARELSAFPTLIINQPYVLVIDQTLGDASIHYGLANADSFQRMLSAALHENPNCTIVLKVHPDVLAKHKRGHFNLVALANNPRIQIIALAIHPVALIEHAQAVYVVTSQIGFEALLWGKPVRTFGMPFYAGWGLTDDELTAPERRHNIILANLIYAALIAYPRYLDPETGKRCEIEHLLNWMALQRQMRERFPIEITALNFSYWKQTIVTDFLQGSQITFLNSQHLTNTATTIAIWGTKTCVIDNTISTQTLRLEDGFIRSVGLGADLIRPLSWVIDKQGIYYNATAPSDLETILQTTCFNNNLLTRAAQLRVQVVNLGITKYNLTASDSLTQLTDTLKTIQQRIILVPGQVESDASLRYGAPVIKTNLALLQAVRQENPQAYIVYKPHPDVVAGLRQRGLDEQQTIYYCDQIIIYIAMGELLPLVDEVHTMTSLTGFEALLRAKKVVCYGRPFYAGWGLTDDKLARIARRTRQLTLDELVAGTLILYPTYISHTTHKFTTPERVLTELLAWRDNNNPILPWWRKLLRPLLKIEIIFKQFFAVFAK